VIGVETDGGGEMTPPRATLVEDEKSSIPSQEGSPVEATPTAHEKSTYGPSTR